MFVCVLRLSVYVPHPPLPPASFCLSISVFESVILDVLAQPQADSIGRAVYGIYLRSLDGWYHGFESR